MNKLDLNPKTNVVARATYEVLGYGMLAFAALLALALGLAFYPLVTGGIVLAVFISACVVVAINIRVAELKCTDRMARYRHEYHDTPPPDDRFIYTTKLGPQDDCKYCVPEGVSMGGE